MIEDEVVKQLFWKGNELLVKYLDPDEVLPTQFYRGVSPDDWKNQPLGNCFRHMEIFNKFNAIPRYCFSCYKIEITPRNVIENFKLMVLFEKIKLPNDNTRKCMVECRENVSGAYKGLIYCTGLEDGEMVLKIIREAVSEDISNKVLVTMKRGCTEYARAYPEYAHMEPGATPMVYREEWQAHEDFIDDDFVFEKKVTTFNQSSYTLNDAKVMLAWLRYASTIGDLSYMSITEQSLPPWQNVKRPEPFQPIDDY